MEMPEGFKRGKKTEQLTEVLEPIKAGHASGEGGNPPPGKPAEAMAQPDQPVEDRRKKNRRAKNGGSSPTGYTALWLITLFSLTLNGALIYTALQIRDQANAALATVESIRAGAGEASDQIDALRSQTSTFVVEVSQSIPVSFTIPVQDVVNVPVNTTVPVSLTVTSQVPGPLGVLVPPIQTPISITIPVSFTVQAPISITVPVSNTVPVHFSIPVDFDLGKPPLGKLLDAVQGLLNRIAGKAP